MPCLPPSSSTRSFTSGKFHKLRHVDHNALSQHMHSLPGIARAAEQVFYIRQAQCLQSKAALPVCGWQAAPRSAVLPRTFDLIQAPHRLLLPHPSLCSYSYVYTLVLPNSVFIFWGWPSQAAQYGGCTPGMGLGAGGRRSGT